MGAIITLTTDFGLADAYVAAMKGVGGQQISGLSRTYAEGRGLLAVIGSDGYLEIARREGNAGDFLGTEVGDEVKIRPQ